MSSLVSYVQKNPKVLVDAEVISIVTLGVAPYANEKFKQNFRLNSFFISESTRGAINSTAADYTPAFLSSVPRLIKTGRIPLDVALIQTSPPDSDGNLNLGIGVDITRAAMESASTVIAQINSHMPRVQGDGVISMDDIDFAVPWDEPLIEYLEAIPGEEAEKIGKYVARIVEDGSTIQVGYGSIPNAIISCLKNKKHLGVHTELLSGGLADLMKTGAVDNSKKSIDQGKAIATFCMGSRSTYDFIDDNPAIEFKTVDYTNNPLVIAKNEGMTAINSAMEVDLTGQATAESLGKVFYSGIGGQADFMRGAVMAPGGTTILALPSTAKGDEVSRIVPCLREGSGVTLTRGDIHYVVTEYGIAYLQGKSIRERAMDLISIAHPKFRPWLIYEAKKMGYIYRDQAFVPGEKGIYPEVLETYRTTSTGLQVLLRPVKITDEPLLKGFFYSLSRDSLYSRFFSARREMPHEDLQGFTVLDYTQKMIILAVVQHHGREIVVGMGQYSVNRDLLTADIGLLVRDEWQKQGLGAELLSYLAYLAKKQGLLGFTAEVLMDNAPVFQLFRKAGFDLQKKNDSGICFMKAMFK